MITCDTYQSVQWRWTYNVPLSDNNAMEASMSQVILCSDFEMQDRGWKVELEKQVNKF